MSGRWQAAAVDPSEKPDVIQEEKVTKSHMLDSLNMLMFLGLLILTVVTIWIFKHRRLRFVHETGLAIIYGLIVGAILAYTSKGGGTTSYADITLPDNANTSFGINSPPDDLHLHMSEEDLSHNATFKYSYQGALKDNNRAEPELEEKATFDPEVFFNVLLPPIIFNAGYQMKRKHFFRNFGAIMTYAFMGTTVSCFVVGSMMYGFMQIPFLSGISIGFKDCLIFGAIISATDPVTVLAIFHDLNVDVDLYALVFGESVLNDAVAIVLAGLVAAVEQYSSASGGFDGMAVLHCLGNFVGVFLGAFSLGSAMGMLTALLTKYTQLRDYPLLETSLFVLMSYSTFMAAEAAGMTGIVAVLFCGICQAHYTFNNLSPESQARTKQLFDLLNFLMENFVFLYIGVSTFTFQKHLWNWWFILSSFIAIIVARACNVYPLSFLLNLGRSNKIRYNFQHMMMFAGLRGAIAFALAIRNTSTPERRIVFSSTLVIVMATVIMCGGFSTQMLQWLKIRYCFSPSEPHPPLHSATPGRLAEKARLVRMWYKVDEFLVKPLLTHAVPPLTKTMPKCCYPLALLLTSPSTQRRREDSDTDLIIDDQDLPSAYGDGPELDSSDHKVNNSQDISLHV
ncbi:hypothetical protein CAPTEDRAFT_184481 [Capitella teleta]|uniref:Sodium/hydrogen exchanger n=1 Tax=Capitella teleta TaxID=283909 RepID=R7TYX3_CAPTE|nr:hypothetical protein CAPTEDRAFT_184481 [Capitella teleta]|eukprot:ELT98939.1 hypothetical protein CAPTEDRAFT_184481 [Capitella teleta]